MGVRNRSTPPTVHLSLSSVGGAGIAKTHILGANPGETLLGAPRLWGAYFTHSTILAEKRRILGRLTQVCAFSRVYGAYPTEWALLPSVSN